jgi:hypothetical protein
MKYESFKKSCQLVENRLRQLGKNCQVIFTDDCVSVAPAEWSGDSTGDTLYEAIKDAENNE